MQLDKKTLNQVALRIPCPTYNRSEIKTGIVHIGVGGFHRSHQAYYMHQLLERFKLTNWAICGVGLRGEDLNMATILRKQDCLYILVTQHPEGKVDSQVIGSIKEYLFAPDNPKAVVDKMAHPDTKIVSLTITEGGYNFNPTTGDFNFANPNIQHDLANPDHPKTVYGYLTASLRKRQVNNLSAFTILSCDNMLHNGEIAKNMVLTFAKKQDPSLAKWIEKEVCFPNAMVDRITPITSSEIKDYLTNQFDIKDEWPVVCEPFIQWVIEDSFTNGRPPLENLGVQFVPDVTPYEQMKIRLLNAGHSVLGIPGAIHGHPTIDSCMRDEVFSKFMRVFMDEEVTPTLGKIEGIDISIYKESLEERFSNPNIKDNVSRICSESSAKLPKFLIPTLHDNLKQGGSIRYATFILAAWCFYSDMGVNEEGEPIEIIDVLEDQLHQAAKNTKTNWLSFLDQPQIFGDLIKNKRFTQKYNTAIKSIYEAKSIRKLMRDYVSN